MKSSTLNTSDACLQRTPLHQETTGTTQYHLHNTVCCCCWCCTLLGTTAAVKSHLELPGGVEDNAAGHNGALVAHTQRGAKAAGAQEEQQQQQQQQ
jgi:hypothetical protein